MNKKLSHSQVNTYLTCGKKYDYHYNHRLRETVTSAALLFGSTLDQTFNEMLLDKKNNKLKEVEYYKTQALMNWKTQKINNNPEDLVESLKIVYAEQDYDSDLLQEQGIDAMYARAKELIPEELIPENVSVSSPLINNETIDLSSSYLKGCDKRENLKATYSKLNNIKTHLGLENLDENIARFINQQNWAVMAHKAQLMVETLYTKILPRIKEVVSVQKKVELTNEEGDSTIGFIDAILVFEGEDFPRIVDLKTSARSYEADSANSSPQLATYGYTENINKTAFIVLMKSIRKNKTKTCSVCNHDGTGGRAQTCDNGKGKNRCNGEWIETISPEADVEVIKGDLNPVFEQNVIDNYETVLQGVNAEIYPRNFNSCNAFGRKCQFYSLCHEGKDTKKLVKV